MSDSIVPGKTLRYSFAFWNATSFVGAGLENWDTSSLRDAAEMFWGASLFNAPISTWDVSKTELFQSMFSSASSFNQPIGNWDVSSATNMTYMFLDATDFNQDLCDWGSKVSSTTQAKEMFDGSSCSETESPDLMFSIPGPWCEFCGTPSPTDYDPDRIFPTISPTTGSPTITYEPTAKPTSAPFLTIGAGSNANVPCGVGALLMTLAVLFVSL